MNIAPSGVASMTQPLANHSTMPGFFLPEAHSMTQHSEDNTNTGMKILVMGNSKQQYQQLSNDGSVGMINAGAEEYGGDFLGGADEVQGRLRLEGERAILDNALDFQE